MLQLATSTAADFTAFTIQEEKRQRAARAVEAKAESKAKKLAAKRAEAEAAAQAEAETAARQQAEEEAAAAEAERKAAERKVAEKAQKAAKAAAAAAEAAAAADEEGDEEGGAPLRKLAAFLVACGGQAGLVDGWTTTQGSRVSGVTAGTSPACTAGDPSGRLPGAFWDPSRHVRPVLPLAARRALPLTPRGGAPLCARR